VLAGDTRLLAARRGPAGLYIGSKTAAEIGLSIMAEVVAAKDGVDAASATSMSEGKKHFA
jgi:xanthine dehydrogenase accessory factor